MTELFYTLATYLHEVFVLKFDDWVVLGLVAQASFTMRFVVQWIASEQKRFPGGVLVFLNWRRRFAVDLRAVSQGPGVHRGPGTRTRGLHSQSVLHHHQRTAGIVRGCLSGHPITSSGTLHVQPYSDVVLSVLARRVK